MRAPRASLLIAAAFAGVCASVPARAASDAAASAAQSDELAGFASVPDDELARYRGGFEWQGVKIGLGAEIRTFLNGELVLQTNISWTPTGAQTTQYVSGALTQVDAAQLQAGLLSTGGITMRVGDQSVYLANQGQTAFIQSTDGGFQNILINRANNISAREEIDATLDLQNFGQFQQQAASSRIGVDAGDLVGRMVSSALGN